MSADNRLCVIYNYNSRQWDVFHGSCSCDYHTAGEFGVESFPTKKAALEHAHKDEEENYYEGGVQVIEKEEMYRALSCEIWDNFQKLTWLKTHDNLDGFQWTIQPAKIKGAYGQYEDEPFVILPKASLKVSVLEAMVLKPFKT